MNVFLKILSSSVGRKWIMAATGFILISFTAVHMLGNLQIFMGPAAINDYAALLKKNLFVLWGFRMFLSLTALVHVITGTFLYLENRKVRGIEYDVNNPINTTLASRTMICSGGIILVFAMLHLAHFTISMGGDETEDYVTYGIKMGTPLPQGMAVDVKKISNVYKMVVEGFSGWAYPAGYVLAIVALALHTSHGFSSMFQSAGLRNGKNAVALDVSAIFYSVVIFAGLAIVPIAVVLKFLK